jgi:TRAP-type C4-dicarboxylate transport system substrate-binding protein
MTRRRSFMAGSASALASIAFVRGPARAAEVVFKWAHAVQLDHPLHVNAVRVKNAVARRSNGRFEIQIFPNNQLGGDPAMLAQARTGAIQLYAGYGGIFQSVAPSAGIEGVGFAFKSQAQALAAFDGALGAYVRREMDAKGPFVTPSKIWVDMFGALGASPTPIAANEMYVALQTHVVDAQENPFTIVETFRLFEVQKYLSVTNHMWSNFWLVANADAFHALPPEFQTMLREEIDRYALTNRREMELRNASLAEKLTRLGMKINVVDVAPFRTKLRGFYEKEQAAFGADAWALLEGAAGKLG